MTSGKGRLVVRTGTYFGEAFVHCNETLTIESDKVCYALTSNVKDEKYPDIVEEMPSSPNERQQLQILADLDALKALPDTIGHPDQADAGGEWIEISDGTTTKRIDFDLNASIPEIEEMVERLRELRNKASQKYKR